MGLQVQHTYDAFVAKGTIFYDWMRKKYHYGAPRRNISHPALWWLATLQYWHDMSEYKQHG
jgi:hypothetical protein